jgi:transcriptional regulator with XRE-family HTH domain
MTLGEKIRQLRLRNGKEVSQRDLAEKIDIAVTYLSKIENGKVKPYLSEEKLKKIAEKLNLTGQEENEIFDLAKKMPPLIKEQTKRNSVNEFLRTAPGISDKAIKEFTKKYKK